MTNSLPHYITKLQQTHFLAEGIIEVKLDCPPNFYWQAGDYLWFGEDATHLKPFSIANIPNKEIICLQIALTEAMLPWWEAIKTKQQLIIQGPVKQYHWPETNMPIVMAAGGTGITPLLSLLQANESRLATQAVTLYWGVRKSDLLFAADELNRLMVRYPLFQWYPVISENETAWTGLTGTIPECVMQQVNTVAQYYWLICGPWPMVQLLKEALITKQVDPATIQ